MGIGQEGQLWNVSGSHFVIILDGGFGTIHGAVFVGVNPERSFGDRL